MSAGIHTLPIGRFMAVCPQCPRIPCL